MAVDIQRGTSVGVSESSGDSADINTIRDQERGSSMPQTVERDQRKRRFVLLPGCIVMLEDTMKGFEGFCPL